MVCIQNSIKTHVKCVLCAFGMRSNPSPFAHARILLFESKIALLPPLLRRCSPSVLYLCFRMSLFAIYLPSDGFQSLSWYFCTYGTLKRAVSLKTALSMNWEIFYPIHNVRCVQSLENGNGSFTVCSRFTAQSMRYCIQNHIKTP